MSKTFKVISPVDDSVVATLPLVDKEQMNVLLHKSAEAQKKWRQVTSKERVAICRKFVEKFQEKKDEIARELTMQMGRPLSQTPGEVRGTVERATYMINVAEECLADIKVEENDNFNKFIRREPLGVILVIAAWNYPYLISVNCVIPAILAGNSVILKQASQTPLCAVRFADAFKAAGLPDGVFEIVNMDHEVSDYAIRHPIVSFVNFTGSVGGGHSIQKSASDKFIATGLELGGKDPAYVRPDCDLDYAVEQLVDGSFFNSGQCCCAIERIYVHKDVYDVFVFKFVELTKQYRLGNPLDPNTNLGPMVKASAAELVRKQIKEAIDMGAKAWIDPSHFPADKVGTPYMAPQVLTNVNHKMTVMMDESFGPVIGIMCVENDEEAIKLMNDSPFGLTACIWTNDINAAISIGDRIDTGTWFMNRCDYLDPSLAWVGVKDSGRGCALSKLAYEHLTHPKSFHLKKLKH